MMKPRYLTKSRFKLGLECPTKLYFTGKSDYANKNLDDPFLLALAEGGFQVGELAKCYFPGGYEIETLDYEEALAQTGELLKMENVIIYEAAVRYENLFIRADILIKNQNHIELVEVKAKSFDISKSDFLTKKGTISSSWRAYLMDIAFQKYVLSCACPNYMNSAYLMLADKTALCPTDGLNQKFLITTNELGRKKAVLTQTLSSEDLAQPILIRVKVDDYCRLIYSEDVAIAGQSLSFSECVRFLADSYSQDKKVPPFPSAVCGQCEFKVDDIDLSQGLKSGFHECWKEALNYSEEDFKEPTVLDIWNFRKKDQMIQDRRVKLCDLDEEDISPKNDGKPGLSLSQRQWLQVLKSQRKDSTLWLDKDNLSQEISSWNYPLHFIDFETTMVAIPFNQGRHPYEGVAFQFSHHVVYEDGRVEHRGQYLNSHRGMFPNYDFIRRLKQELEQDQGSIFRYSNHENTYLNLIYRQLIEDQSPIQDREELCEFIRSITSSVKDSPEKWEGPRSMIDMWELVKRYYYDPDTKGSNSIKKVLPSILNRSRFLQEKYAHPIYGADAGIKSLNYKAMKWMEYQDDHVIDPYKLLPKLFQDISDKDMILLSDDEELRDGGAALTAYARMQFEEMSDLEREELSNALLRYCELDTLAMVMIYEGWRDLTGC